MIIPNLSKRLSEKVCKRDYSGFYQYLQERYPEVNFYARLYAYKNNYESIPVCPVCGRIAPFIDGGAGFRTYCSRKCVDKSTVRTDKIRSTKLDRYGDPAYNNMEKCKQTCTEKYGGMYTQTEEFKEKARQTKLNRYNDPNFNNREKREQTCRERYGGVGNESELLREKVKQTKLKRYNNPNFNNTEKYRCTCTEKYGSMYTQTEEFKEKARQTCLEKYGVLHYNNPKKIHDTKQVNHTFNTSSIETQFKAYLDSKGVRYNYQYFNELYPFNCDFYLPDYDLYIEIQGTWTHGGHPYTGSEEDKMIVECWKSKNTKYYDNAIQTWTVGDVNKRETARLNKLNYLEIFSCDIEDIKRELNTYLLSNY